jgi:hypothetical protein
MIYEDTSMPDNEVLTPNDNISMPIKDISMMNDNVSPPDNDISIPPTYPQSSSPTSPNSPKKSPKLKKTFRPRRDHYNQRAALYTCLTGTLP